MPKATSFQSIIRAHHVDSQLQTECLVLPHAVMLNFIKSSFRHLALSLMRAESIVAVFGKILNSTKYELLVFYRKKAGDHKS